MAAAAAAEPSPTTTTTIATAFPLFTALFPELQCRVALALDDDADDATGMSLALTCKCFYEATAKPPAHVYRPRLTWPAFARACVLHGHTGLVAWALDDWGMPLHLFTPHVPAATARNHAECVMALLARVAADGDEDGYANVIESIVRVLPDAHAARGFEAYDWFHERYAPEHVQSLRVATYLRTHDTASLMAAVPPVKRRTAVGPTERLSDTVDLGTVEQYGTLALVYFLEQVYPDSFAYTMDRDASPRIGANPSPGMWRWALRKGCHSNTDAISCMYSGIHFGNLPFLRFLLAQRPGLLQRVSPLIHMFVLAKALCHHQFAIFDWLREECGLAWDPTTLGRLHMTMIDMLPVDMDNWLPAIVDALEERQLPFFACDLPSWAMTLSLARRYRDRGTSRGLPLVDVLPRLMVDLAPRHRGHDERHAMAAMVLSDATGVDRHRATAAVLLSDATSARQRQAMCDALTAADKRTLVKTLHEMASVYAIPLWRRDAAIAYARAQGCAFDRDFFIRGLLLGDQFKATPWLREWIREMSVTGEDLEAHWPGGLRYSMAGWKRIHALAQLGVRASTLTATIEYKALCTTYGQDSPVVVHAAAALRSVGIPVAQHQHLDRRMLNNEAETGATGRPVRPDGTGGQ